jgi:hypothetical protein
MPYASPAQRRFMYSQRPAIAQDWERKGHNYIAGKGGGYMNRLADKFNTALGGYEQPTYDPYAQQARLNLMDNQMKTPQIGTPGLQELGVKPLNINKSIDTMSILPSTRGVF